MAPALVASSPGDGEGRSNPQHARTLLLSPPSLASRPQALDAVLSAHDRTRTDLQMLDRLSLGMVTLPDSTYDVVMILSDSDEAASKAAPPLGREVFDRVFRALKPGGRIRSQASSNLGRDGNNQALREAILAGLVLAENGVLVKPEAEAVKSVPLRRKTQQQPSHPPSISDANLSPQAVTNGKRKSSATEAPSQPIGVGFVDFTDDLNEPVITGEEDDDDDLIDENTLLDEADLAAPILQPPPECLPKTGKRRRACKDCTCGLKEKLEAEDAARRSNADQSLRTMKLAADDLTELDFTVQGKVGSCGNCALGDAFRCDGCPYIGLPAFKPGEEVRLLNNDVQL